MENEEIKNIRNDLDKLDELINKIEEKNIPEMQKIVFDENKNLLHNYNELSKNKKKKKTKWVITFGFLDFIAIICIFLMYGPFAYFRNLWVTSAMTTMNHKYLAYIFFSQNKINTIMSNNIVIEVEGETDTSQINFEKNENIVYSSKEEEQVLKRNKNDIYKVIDIEGDGYKGHMLIIYDPSKIKLEKTPSMSYGQTLEEFIDRTEAIAGINASGFNYSNASGYSFMGDVIIDGKIVAQNGSTKWGGGIIGFNKDNILVLTKSSARQAIEMGIRDAVSFGPFLIVNGEPSKFKGNGGYGIAPRTAIGQRKDGIVLMLVIDGRRPGHSLGVDMVELTNIMLKYGAYNASNLDGGGSSTLYADGKVLSIAGGYGYQGDRYIPNAWLVYE